MSIKELDALIKAVELSVADIKKYDACECSVNLSDRGNHAQSVVGHVAMCLIPALADYKAVLKGNNVVVGDIPCSIANPDGTATEVKW